MQLSHVLLLVAAAATAQAANNVPEHIVFSAPGASDVVANGFGCVNITPKGAGNNNNCVKRIFTDGFTVNINDQGPGGVDTQCSIKGFEGTCGKHGIGIKVTPFGTETGNAPPPTGPEGLPNNGKFSAELTTQPRVSPKAGAAKAVKSKTKSKAKAKTCAVKFKA